MSQYFDTDFFKFLVRFIVIVVGSCLIIFGTRIYEARHSQVDPATQTATSNN